jgi:hypothetical protein
VSAQSPLAGRGSISRSPAKLEGDRGVGPSVPATGGCPLAQ